MKKFLVLYRSSMSAMEQMSSMSAEARKAGMDQWMKWGSSAGSALVDWGSPLGESTTLRGQPGAGYVGGYSIVQAESLDAAKRLLDGHPHFGASGASIDVHAIMPMPGAGGA